MRLVKWVDENGFKHRAYVREEDSDDMAMESGIPADPPDLSRLDWDEIQRELHNMLSDFGLFTIEDVTKSRTGLENSVKAVVQAKITALYRNVNPAGE